MIRGMRDVDVSESAQPGSFGSMATSAPGTGGFTSDDRAQVRKSLGVIAALLGLWAIGRARG